MSISQNHYTLTIYKSISEIRELLSKNTLERESKKSIAREMTKKIFIGEVKDKDFAIIDSSPVGIICKLDGTLQFISDKQTDIKIETNIQRVFKRLFIIWLALISIGIIIGPFLPGQNFSFPVIVLFIIVILVFRFIGHGVYCISRNKSIRKIEDLLS